MNDQTFLILTKLIEAFRNKAVAANSLPYSLRKRESQTWTEAVDYVQSELRHLDRRSGGDYGDSAKHLGPPHFGGA